MIVVSELTVRYGTAVALNRVSASFTERTVTALIGHNGSGKSTLLHALAGILRPTSGSIDGLRGRRVAYVPQRTAVGDNLPLTVRELVGMGAWQRRGLWRRLTPDDREAVEAALTRLGITDIAARQVGALSGGQRQRALLAQALVQRGDLLLLDEPTTGLDAQARAVINDVIDEEAARGAIVVVATHELLDAERAGRTLTLTAGSLQVPTDATVSGKFSVSA
ncbi:MULTISPECIES: zinc ABC transporter ATP-binding protein AztA [Rhodococcus]|uniref:Zinc ABC transporter ATP-binding protein AztA n=1 Tax=Rhodococcus oxybenzonivorans TaxID=1990687 RepID=A0AAE4V368_9NOCA|nr:MULTISPECIES: zinc ABC transporter ATP-binding protein AztA [Rhodococcus]MDV7241469.1 zinc ABC transporter ATP-binding protein AztA [Rhodococcus oxybenzonivorans]MDV7267602.1 zinc ABC transporter ATP-binding protein AztA [Rhodococcus oxybenzonivorans]MDV7273998.1 zinc ABC transporter ATP-binding protein AztA [Rhodococcus oxybenzonivorans]MDV7333750.1 zinc ABC transporter ATP-binding protein AztA [Rhodococcus oxybenzonivorans]MDV7343169.1 zinc ABC transporter ATP-binding protein AztA [Rhodoc